MALTIKHNFVSTKPDGPHTDLLQPSHWNEDHFIEGMSDELLPITNSIEALEAINTDRGEPTGFVNRTSTLSWSSGVFTITGNHDIYLKGVKHSKTTASINITGDGQHYIVYDMADGVLKELVGGWYLGDGPACPVAVIYINGSNALLQEERHGIQMDWETHHYLHDTRGVVWGQGGGWTPGVGGAFTVGAYDIYDEDIELEWDNDITVCTVMHRKAGNLGGASTIAAINNPTIDLKVDGQTAWDNNGTATGTTTGYVCYYVYGTTCLNAAVLSFMGPTAHNNITAARAENPANLSLLPGVYRAEFRLFYKVIVRSNNIVESTDYRNVSSMPSQGISATDHQSLINRDAAGAHSVTAITGAISDCPDDGKIYVRRFGAWEELTIS